MINQIKNLIEDIENCTDKNEIFLKHTELSKLILENLPPLDSETISSMRDNDMLSDIFYEVDESSKVLCNFISKNIDYIEDDMKGSDFESQVKQNNERLIFLNEKLKIKSKEQKELQKQKNEIKELQRQIDEYDLIDIDKIKIEKEQMLLILNELKTTKGDDLLSYKKHLEENKKINITTNKIEELSNNIENNLKEMDKLYLDIINN